MELFDMFGKDLIEKMLEDDYLKSIRIEIGLVDNEKIVLCLKDTFRPDVKSIVLSLLLDHEYTLSDIMKMLIELKEKIDQEDQKEVDNGQKI